jgi:hypothetical protein
MRSIASIVAVTYPCEILMFSFCGCSKASAPMKLNIRPFSWALIALILRVFGREEDGSLRQSKQYILLVNVIHTSKTTLGPI